MEQRFQKLIQNLLGDIEINNENNARLSSEVISLKLGVSESKKDILIIEEYMKNNLKQ